jgi:hypothetical protein
VETFPLPLTPDAVRSLKIRRHLFGFWQQWLERARLRTIDNAICDAVAEVLGRDRFYYSPAGRAMQTFVSRPLAAIGFTPSRLKQIDDTLLHGRGVQTFRKLRWRLRS